MQVHQPQPDEKATEIKSLKESLKDKVMAKYRNKDIQGRSTAGVTTGPTDTTSHHHRNLSYVNVSSLQDQIQVNTTDKQKVKRRQFSINASTLLPSHGRKGSRASNIITSNHQSLNSSM